MTFLLDLKSEGMYRTRSRARLLLLGSRLPITDLTPCVDVGSPQSTGYQLATNLNLRNMRYVVVH